MKVSCKSARNESKQPAETCDDRLVWVLGKSPNKYSPFKMHSLGAKSVFNDPSTLTEHVCKVYIHTCHFASSTWTSFYVWLDEDGPHKGIVEEDKLHCEELHDHGRFQVHVCAMVLVLGQVDGQRRPNSFHDLDVGCHHVLDVFRSIQILQSPGHVIWIRKHLKSPFCYESIHNDDLIQNEKHKRPMHQAPKGFGIAAP